MYVIILSCIMCQVEDLLDAVDEPPQEADDDGAAADLEWQEAAAIADNEVDAALVEADAPDNFTASDKTFAPRWTQDSRGVICSGSKRLGILLIQIVKSVVCVS